LCCVLCALLEYNIPNAFLLVNIFF
jgi:hypothetical protein